MTEVLFGALGFLHAAALIGLIVLYARHINLPWREWPLFVFILFWIMLITAGYLVSLVNALGSLPSYAVASFMAVGLVLLAHHAVCALPRKTPYLKIEYPVFTALESPKLRRFLWILLIGSLVLAFLVHLVVCLSFYPVNADSLNYRLPRTLWYIGHGNAMHPFVSVDKRLTFYPLNGVLLYVPLALYGVSSVFFSLPSLLSWMLIGYVTYRFARGLQAERLIATFALWLVAMVPSILVEASSTNDEILAAAPLLAGLYFAWRWLSSGTEHYLFLAALGLGLCIGTKLHIFFLLPVMLIGLAWFLWFLLRRRESWRRWLPSLRFSAVLMCGAALAYAGLLFLALNYWSSGAFYFFSDTAQQVLNTGASLQVAMQNFLIYTASIIIAPIADLNFWQDFHAREITNQHLNDFFMPLLRPLVDNNPAYFHLQYKFMGVIIPTSVLLVEYGLWPGFVWLLWPLQATALARQKFTLRPFFIMLAATPLIWLIVWSCVTLYMEGAPTYFAFYLMVAAPAAVFCFARARSVRADRIRWALIGFVVLTNLVIDGNVAVNNTFRGLWHFTENYPWPFDWLRFEKQTIDEIERANKIQIPITHGKVYYFAFMHWNPRALYYGPYQAAPDDPTILHILSTPSEFSFGFMPVKFPGKPTPGLTYLGHIRGVDREAIFAFGNGVAARHPGENDYISLHATVRPDGRKYKVVLDPVVAGLNAGDQLEFHYTIKGPDQKVAFERAWGPDPIFSTTLPRNPDEILYLLTLEARSAVNYGKVVTETFALGGKGMWCIQRPGEPPCRRGEDD